ncbi:protein Brevis radix-like 1 [Sesamum indicum]|uniref:Protein Brevis radix-like 1 n=1 Tax=Sesamum indicum TaxID=4182 RepID=A0A6I9T6G5_SESIN|nr:protein Brevis radix-like 1 [Sesamum indicum]XP_020548875.1 protein Brevis radix-like 1 [Sesamum indicum]
MSQVYDNWERLVSAVVKREQIWQLCHDHSRSPSISSQSSDFSSVLHDDDLMTSPLYQERREGTGLPRVTGPSVSGQASSGPKEQFPRRRYENNPRNNPDELLLALGRTQEPMLETNFDEILKSANLDGPFARVGQPDECEWIQRYEPGVYVTLVCLKNGSTDVERVRFSRRIFEKQEAEAWWIKNREQVYYRYNARAGLTRIQLLRDSRRQQLLRIRLFDDERHLYWAFNSRTSELLGAPDNRRQRGLTV